MKDSNRSLTISNAVMTIGAILVIAFLAILSGVFISNGSALASESPEDSRISADINESYFVTDENARLAQGGKLETRSEQQEESDTSDNEAETESDEVDTANDSDLGQCESLYLEDHLRIDFDNDPEEVLKLQSFLKTYENYDYVSLNGSFDAATLRAVESFQARYADDILTPWGYQADEATGYVYITTKQKINEIYCDEQFMLSREQQTEIREYREKLNQWRSQGASFETPQYLANYYGYGQTQSTSQPQVAADTDDTNEADRDQSDRQELEPRTSEGGVTVTETPDDTATSATSTEEDDRNFFQRLFGIGGSGDATTTAATTSTTTDEDTEDDTDTNEDESDDETVATTATSTATSSNLDDVAAGVYSGVNGIIDFLLSPTFLLVVLVVLILLLIATLIEADPEEGSEDSDEEDDDGNDAGNNDEDEEKIEKVETEEETTGEAWDEYAEAEVVDEPNEVSEDSDKKGDN